MANAILKYVDMLVFTLQYTLVDIYIFFFFFLYTRVKNQHIKHNPYEY